MTRRSEGQALTRKGGGERIQALQALRALAFLGIFLSHVSIAHAWAGLSVSVFFVLSGFLLVLRYNGRALPQSLGERFAFARRHIARIYPLHLITMALFLILRLIIEAMGGLTRGMLLYDLGMTALNVTLLQSWVPDHLVNVSLNGVAWFLSAMLFLYFIFPSVFKLARRMPGWGRLLAVLLIPIAQIALCVPAKRWMGVDMYNWFSYCFPIFRLGDFFAGCCLGVRFLCSEWKREDAPASAAATAAELLLLCLMVGENLLRHQAHLPPFLELCFINNTSLYIYLALAWVWLFARHAGLLSRLLACRPLIAVGNISAYAYLIHYVLTQYAYHSMALFSFYPQGWTRAAIIAAELLVSLLLSAFYRKMISLRTQLKGVSVISE